MEFGGSQKKLEEVVGWNFDFPAASLESCEECKEERGTHEPCPECPYLKYPVVLSETSRVLMLWQDLNGAMGQIGLSEMIFRAHFGKVNRYETIFYVKCLNSLGEIIAKFRDRELQIKRIADGDNN